MPDLDSAQIWTEAADLADELAEAGEDQDKVARAIAEFLDAILPMGVLLPGVVGIAAEAADGPAFEQLVRAIVELLKVDPEKRAERRARREARREARRARRQK